MENGNYFVKGLRLFAAVSIAEMEELSDNAMCTIMSVLRVDSTIRILFATFAVITRAVTIFNWDCTTHA